MNFDFNTLENVENYKGRNQRDPTSATIYL